MDDQIQAQFDAACSQLIRNGWHGALYGPRGGGLLRGVSCAGAVTLGGLVGGLPRRALRAAWLLPRDIPGEAVLYLDELWGRSIVVEHDSPAYFDGEAWLVKFSSK